MPRLEPVIASGSLLDFYGQLWGPLYEAVLSILGSTGTILPFGDPRHGQPNATTFTTIGEEQVVFTWSEAPASFATPLDLKLAGNFQGIIPVLTCNGTDEEADSPDAVYWSRVGAVFSVGAWVNLTDATNALFDAKRGVGMTNTAAVHSAGIGYVFNGTTAFIDSEIAPDSIGSQTNLLAGIFVVSGGGFAI
ncbi:hypothetical protein LCGC14_1500670, partial [marine sediment metagenome]